MIMRNLFLITTGLLLIISCEPNTSESLHATENNTDTLVSTIDSIPVEIILDSNAHLYNILQNEISDFLIQADAEKSDLRLLKYDYEGVYNISRDEWIFDTKANPKYYSSEEAFEGGEEIKRFEVYDGKNLIAYFYKHTYMDYFEATYWTKKQNKEIQLLIKNGKDTSYTITEVPTSFFKEGQLNQILEMEKKYPTKYENGFYQARHEKIENSEYGDVTVVHEFKIDSLVYVKYFR